MAQAISSRRFSVNRTVGTALAAGLIVAGIAGATALNTTNSVSFSGSNTTERKAITAHYVAGQGEGLFGDSLAVISATPVASLQAYASVGQGEGLVGNTFATVPRTIKAYHSDGQGEGRIGGAGQ